jgi:hypothetical protein
VNAGSGEGDTVDTGVVILSGECRPLRRSLRSLVWQVLEEVALDAVVEDGRLVARTSARQVAEGLGIDPGTAAAALRALRQRGLVSPSRETGPAGRFGLSVYQLHPFAGLSVVRPCTAEPFTVSTPTGQPRKEEPTGASPLRAAPYMASSRMKERAPRWGGGQVAQSRTASDPDSTEAIRGEDSPGRPDRSTDSPGSSRHCPGQTALDLELGSW